MFVLSIPHLLTTATLTFGCVCLIGQVQRSLDSTVITANERLLRRPTATDRSYPSLTYITRYALICTGETWLPRASSSQLLWYNVLNYYVKIRPFSTIYRKFVLCCFCTCTCILCSRLVQHKQRFKSATSVQCKGCMVTVVCSSSSRVNNNNKTNIRRCNVVARIKVSDSLFKGSDVPNKDIYWLAHGSSSGRDVLPTATGDWYTCR